MVLSLLSLFQINGSWLPIRVEALYESFYLIDAYHELQMQINLTAIYQNFSALVSDYNLYLERLHIQFHDDWELSTCWTTGRLQARIYSIERKFIQLHEEDISSRPARQSQVPDLPPIDEEDRHKRSLVPVLGTILSRLIGTGTEETERKLENNQHLIHEEYNILNKKFTNIISAIKMNFENENRLATELQVEAEELSKLATSLHNTKVLNNHCAILTKAMDKSLEAYAKIGSTLVKIKDKIPYGSITTMVTPDYLNYITQNLTATLHKTNRTLINENINKLPVFKLYKHGNILVISTFYPASSFASFNALQISPAIFTPSTSSCNISHCAFQKADIGLHAVVGLSEDNRYFTRRPHCQRSALSPISLCHGRGPVLTVDTKHNQDCLLDLILKNTSACSTIEEKSIVALPIFEHLRNNHFLVTTNRFINTTIMCEKNTTQREFAPGSHITIVEEDCSLSYGQKEEIRQNLHILHSAPFKLPPSIANLSISTMTMNIHNTGNGTPSHVAFSNDVHHYKFKPISLNTVYDNEELINHHTWVRSLSLTSLGGTTTLFILAGVVIIMTRKYVIHIINTERQKRKTMVLARLDTIATEEE